MILSVSRLDDELKIVRFEAGSRLEGSRLGNNPVTPVKTTKTMVRQEKMKGLACFAPAGEHLDQQQRNNGDHRDNQQNRRLEEVVVQFGGRVGIAEKRDRNNQKWQARVCWPWLGAASAQIPDCLDGEI